MRTKIVEATNGFNFGKFLVGQLEEDEIAHPSSIDHGRTTIVTCGYGLDLSLWRWVLDLQTREGIFTEMRGYAKADLDKHQVWVCPMFEPTLARLYQYGPTPVEDLPDLIELSVDEAPGALHGYRREGDEVN